MHIGCCTSCLTPFMPLNEAVRRIAELGFPAVEFNMSGAGSYAGEWPQAQRDEIFSCIDRCGLSVNLHINANDLCRRSRNEKRDLDGLIEQCLGVLPYWANRLPLRCVTFDASFHRPYRSGGSLPAGTEEKQGVPPAACASRMLLSWFHQTLRQAMKPVIPSVVYDQLKMLLHPVNIDDTAVLLNAFSSLARGGVTLGVENYLSGMCRPEDFARLRAAAPGDWGVLLDTGHAQVASRAGLIDYPCVAAYIRALPERIVDVHISDNDGTADAHRRPGAGTIDMAAVVAALQDKQYSGGLMLEFTAPSESSTCAALAETMSLFDRLIHASPPGLHKMP